MINFETTYPGVCGGQFVLNTFEVHGIHPPPFECLAILPGRQINPLANQKPADTGQKMKPPVDSGCEGTAVRELPTTAREYARPTISDLHERFRVGKGNGTDERVRRLARIQSRMLNDYRHIGLNQAGVIRPVRNRLGISQVVEADMFGAARFHGDFVRPNRLAVRIKDPDLQVRFLVRSVEHADAFVAGHFRFRPVAAFGNITFADGPAFVTDGRELLLFDGIGFHICLPGFDRANRLAARIAATRTAPAKRTYAQVSMASLNQLDVCQRKIIRFFVNEYATRNNSNCYDCKLHSYLMRLFGKLMKNKGRPALYPLASLKLYSVLEGENVRNGVTNKTHCSKQSSPSILVYARDLETIWKGSNSFGLVAIPVLSRRLRLGSFGGHITNNGLGARVNMQFFENMFQMTAYCINAQIDFIGDELVGIALGEQ